MQRSGEYFSHLFPLINVILTNLNVKRKVDEVLQLLIYRFEYIFLIIEYIRSLNIYR